MMHYSTYNKPYLFVLNKMFPNIRRGQLFFLTSAYADSGCCPYPCCGGVACPYGCERAYVPCCDGL